jgi:hypothetical protein
MTGCYVMTHRCALNQSEWTLARNWCISELGPAIQGLETPDAVLNGPELRLYGGPAEEPPA